MSSFEDLLVVDVLTLLGVEGTCYENVKNCRLIDRYYRWDAGVCGVDNSG